MIETLDRIVPRSDAPRGWHWRWVPERHLMNASWPIWQCPLQSTTDPSGRRWFLVLQRGNTVDKL